MVQLVILAFGIMFNGSSQMWQTNANGTGSGSTGPSSANSSTDIYT